MSRIAHNGGHYGLHRRAGMHIADRGCQFGDGVYEALDLARLARSRCDIKSVALIADVLGNGAAGLLTLRLRERCLAHAAAAK